MSLPKIYAPNLHLFAFHRRNPLHRDSSANPVEGAQQLWEKWGSILQIYGYDKPLDLWGYYPPKGETAYDPTEEPAGSIVNLYKNGILDFKGVVEVEGEPTKFTGIACPRRMYDSYALALNIRRPDKEGDRPTEPVSIAIYREFNSQGILLPDFVASSLGQTLLITADLTPEQKQFSSEGLKQLAHQCLEQFIPDADKRPEFNRKGRMFGSLIFEFGKFNHLETADSAPNILVLFFREEAMRRKFETSYWDIIELWYYRNQVISSFIKSRSIYQASYDTYQEISQQVGQVNEQFLQLPESRNFSQRSWEGLKSKLKIMPSLGLEYARLQRDLELQLNRITIFSKKYDATLGKIQQKQSLDVLYLKPVDLSFLKCFTQEDARDFKERIKADLDYLMHGNGLVEQAIAAIRGMVEVEKAARDRIRETKLEAMAAGIGTAVVVASSSILLEENPIPFSYSDSNTPRLHPFFTAILLSAIAGILVFSFSVTLLTWIRRHK